MSDKDPILPPGETAPPLYGQVSCSAPSPAFSFNPQPEAPPPYTPRNIPYPSASESTPITSGQNYHRFDVGSENELTVANFCHLGPKPCQIHCPSCGQFVMTVTYYRAGTLTFISSALCFLFCIVCTFLPFCMDELQDVEHYCPVCKFFFGTFRRI